MKPAFLLGLAATIVVSSFPGKARAACDDMATAFRSVPVATTKRAVTARDLIELRDIGDPTSQIAGAPTRLAISPDGTKIAFALVRADLASNGYCLAMFVSDLAVGATPRMVDAGGEYRLDKTGLRGFLAVDGGMTPTRPTWSPDGGAIAYLRRDRGVTQAWVANADGSGAHAVSREPGDVATVAWASEGSRLLYSTSPAAVASTAAIEREGASGWLYDDRVFTGYDLRPLVADDLPRVVMSVSRDGSNARVAGASEGKALPPDYVEGYPVPPEAIAGSGRRAWTEHEGGGAQTPLALSVANPDGSLIKCAAAWCRGSIIGLWWNAAGRELFIERREGWDHEKVTFYRWVPGTAKPIAFLSATDTIQDCGWAAAGLACTLENATTPRRVVLIDRRTGRISSLLDPNPMFASIALGRVQRLRAKNAFGLESWGDLVLPPGYRKGTRLPLVIVQYVSQGFLRGGTGNEYPIYLLAARGYAVLSFQRPPFVSAASPATKTTFQLQANSLKGWAERRNTLLSLLAELDLAVATGSIDERRVGITGQSDGSSTVRFAMINSKRFAAAAISTCCFDPTSVMAGSGPAFSVWLSKMGFPPLTKPDRDFWKDYSLVYSGDRTDTPLLMQLADHEGTDSVETFQALREFGKPVESYIFPNEYHVKWQPAHRLASYQRAIDWFDFWLLGREDNDPTKRAQYDRWRAMRAAWRRRPPGG